MFEKMVTYNKKCPICFKKNVKIIFLEMERV